MSRFIPVDRQTDYLLPPSVDEWLPDGHLARFVVAVVEPLDLSALTWRYAGRGHNAHHPAALLSLLVYVMPVTGKGFDQCYNAQAAVDTDTLLVTHVHVTQAPNDKQQVAPLIGPLYKGSGS